MKICPKCKKIDEVIVKSYPVKRVEGFRVSGKDSPKVKQIVDVHHFDNLTNNEVYCPLCNYLYEGCFSAEDAWEIMIWREK